MTVQFSCHQVEEKLTSEDARQVHRLMAQLAEIEGYLTQFKVSEKALIEAVESGSIELIVARSSVCSSQEGGIVGMLLYYRLPFTYDMNKCLYIKELMVSPDYQSRGVGAQLFKCLTSLAKQQKVSKIRWEVLASNEKAASFYRSLGGCHETGWNLYSFKFNELV